MMNEVSLMRLELLLPAVLSLIAGSLDVISFLGLDGLFNAHITGNLVIIAAHVVAGQAANMALLLSVPIFFLVLALTSLLAAELERAGVASLRPLLLLQFLLLAGFLALGVAEGSHMDLNVTNGIVAGLLGVSAMAVQNALVQISLRGAPTTAVLTTTVTRLTVDLAEVLVNRTAPDAPAARRRIHRSWPVIVGFTAGAGLGAASFATAGLWSLALPTALALVALAMSVSTKLNRAQW
jgi:uncharacterized membrane protein YoaK (UPF0700 family)